MSPTSPRVFRRLSRVCLVGAMSVLLLPQAAVAAKGNKAEMRAAMNDADPDAPFGKAAKRDDFDAPMGKASKRDDSDNLRGGRPAPGEADARMLAKLREKLGVNDDDEWGVISERLTKVQEMKKLLSTGGRGAVAAAVADRGKKAPKSATNGRPEMDALKAAVSDQSPDAEIRSRLARAHDVYVQNLAQLQRAESDLRAVLSVRQEAVVVTAGFLPP